MVILFFFVDNMWDLDYKITDADFVDNVATNKCKVYTILFNTFIYLHLFNEFNCRKVGATEFNVFHNVFANWYFIFIVVGLMVAQYFFVNWGSTMTRCAPLDAQQHAFCIVIGSTVLLIGALIKLTPVELTNKMPILVDENKAVDENNKIMAMYNQQANAKVTKSKVQDEVANE
jgi:magnesium-transporting ATPase (P-type)